MWRLAAIAILASGAFGSTPAASQQRSISLDQVLICLERKACFGECPAYTVTIHGDGIIVFEGTQYVAHVGRATGQADRDAVIELINRLLEFRFFDLPAEYNRFQTVRHGSDSWLVLGATSVSDGGGAILRLQLGDQQHSVFLRCRVPTCLQALAEAVDELAGTKKWVYGDSE
jgi:hypothetical protein